MGNVKKLIKEFVVRKPHLNKRFTIELCENVHLHYRNLRLEFSKNEFIQILKLLKTLDEDEIDSFKYGSDKFKSLIKVKTLPSETEWNDRLQIEEQEEGHYHIHYRNFRIEFSKEEFKEWIDS